MPVVTVLTGLLLTAAGTAAERGENLLANAGFEEAAGGLAESWNAAGNGYELVPGRKAGTAIYCESEADDQTSGAMQVVAFDPPVKHPFMVSGWSKSEGASGADYCLYMDCWYDDGTNLWGQRGDFEQGTHGWQRVEYVFHPEKPITRIEFFILFRRCSGKAWLDDMALSLAPFKLKRERVIPSLYGGNSIDYSATLSLPAEWTASVVSGGERVYSTSGTGLGVALNWAGGGEGGEHVVRVEATDALLGESLVHETTTRTKPGEGRGFVAWTESSMKRVLIDAMPPNGERRTARIALAGNEYESLQLAIRAAAGQGLEGCTVELSDLKGPGGAVIEAENIEWHQVGFVNMAELFEHPHMTHATPGWWPDPLLEVEEFDVPGGVTQSLWFTVYAPEGTQAGEYRGEFSIWVGDGAIRVPVRATVYGFDIPTQPHIKTAFALMDGYLEKLYGKPLDPAIRRAYGDYVLKHRLNPDDISRTDPPDLDDLEHYDANGLNTYNVLNMVEHRGDRTWVCWSPLEVYTQEFKADLSKRLDPYVEELKRRGFKDKAYVYTFDERGQDFWPIMKEYFGLIKERYGIPTLTTAKVPQDPQVMRDLNVDWNCPVSSQYRFEEAEKCREAGLQVWTYVCLGPRYPFANFLADDPLVEARVIWWQMYHQKCDGLLYWGLNIWGRENNDYLIDPEADGPRLQWSITTGGRWNRLHGDGELLYAGKDGPIGSIRLANLRDGIEDYEYLWKLAELTDLDTARTACEPVTTSLTAFTREPTTVEATRRRVARTLERQTEE